MPDALPPPGRTRGYSFADHSTYQPNTPHPGDRLDAEFDTLYAGIDFVLQTHDGLFTPTGMLRPHSISMAHLDPDLVEIIKAEVHIDLTTQINTATAQVGYAIAAADRANHEALRAEGAATRANQLASSVGEHAQVVETARRAVQHDTATVTTAAAEVDNFASDAELSAVHAHLDQELAGAWAEFLEGNEPIPAMYFAHTAITGQHWSSRWWAHKAAGAFGAMSELYLGAHPTPPTTTSTGEPIPIGAIYYNTTNNQVYVWNGTEWMPFWNPAPALVLTLVYQAAAGQTVFPLTTPDLGGNTYTISASSPEPASVFVNGVRLPQDAPVLGMGDWLIDNTTSTVTMNQPLKLGDTVQIDLLAPASSLAPSRVQTQQLLDFDIDPATDLPGEIDGATASFPLVAVPPPHAPIPVTSAQELFVSVDGVVQQPGTDYNVSGGAIHFGEPLIQGARAWALWYGPGATL